MSNQIGHAGQTLRDARETAGISQKLLAAIFGVSRPYLSQMESGSKPLIKKAIEFIEKNAGRGLAGSPKQADLVTFKSLETIKFHGTKTAIKRSHGHSWAHVGGDVPKRRGEWSSWWEKRHHDKCLNCSKECKQSFRVKIIYCPDYLTKTKSCDIINAGE